MDKLSQPLLSRQLALEHLEKSGAKGAKTRARTNQRRGTRIALIGANFFDHSWTRMDADGNPKSEIGYHFRNVVSTEQINMAMDGGNAVSGLVICLPGR